MVALLAIARDAGDLRMAYYSMPTANRAGSLGINSAEQSYHSGSNCRSEMKRAGITAYQQFAVL